MGYYERKHRERWVLAAWTFVLGGGLLLWCVIIKLGLWLWHTLT